MKRNLLLFLVTLLPLVAGAYDAEIDGIYYNFSEDEATVTYRDSEYRSYSGSVTIPETITYDSKTYTVTAISGDAFACCYDLNSVVIPNSVTSIGNCAFMDCVGLTSVVIPNGVTNIKSGAFYSCVSLTSVTIPKSVTSIGRDAFCCENLISVTFESDALISEPRTHNNSLQIIFGHYKVKEFVIGDEVSNIGSYAFYSCGMESVRIGSGVTNIGEGAFGSCRGLTDVYCYAETVPGTGTDIFNDCPIASATLHVPAGSIDLYKTTSPWSEFGNIVALPAVANEYKDPATNVIYTYYPASNKAEVKKGYEHFVENWYGPLFEPGSPDAKDEIIILDKITINGKEYIVDKIGYCAFSYNKNITSVIIPSSVKSIEYGAFLGCSSLSNVVFSRGLNSIGWLAFNNCSNLKQISLPEGLKSIGGGAFSFCGMSDITIPSCVEEIGNMQAFYSPALKTITSLIKDPFEVDENFNSKLRDVTLRVPVGTKTKYEATTGWRIFQTIEEFLYTEEPVTFSKNQVATIILPITPDASKGKYYRLDRCEEGKIIFEQELQPQARVPYIIIPNEDFSIDPSTMDLEGLSHDAVSIEGISFIGSYSHEEFSYQEGFYIDIIDTTPDCLDDWFGSGKAIVGPLRAYLQVNWDDPYTQGGTRSPQEKMEIVLKDHGTGINEIQDSKSKIQNESVIFDLQGRRLFTKPSRGIYIKGGKKKVKR